MNLRRHLLMVNYLGEWAHQAGRGLEGDVVKHLDRAYELTQDVDHIEFIRPTINPEFYKDVTEELSEAK